MFTRQPSLEIQLEHENDTLVLTGSSQESNGILLKGQLLLTLHDVTPINRIHLRLIGRLKVSWQKNDDSTAHQPQKFDQVFLEREWDFLSQDKGKQKLQPGEHSYPFDAFLPGDVYESVEGMKHAFVIHKLKAVVERPRFSGSSLKARKHLRLVRALAQTDLAWSHSMNVQNIWPNKVRYNIETPSKAVIIGSDAGVNISIQSLLKGISIGRIIISLREYYTLSTPSDSTFNDFRILKTIRIDDPEPSNSLDSWEISCKIPIPPSLTACTQDVENPYIKVRHKIRFHISINNPDGHVSELRASLPIALHISPTRAYLPQNQFPEALEDLPLYSNHVFDRRLWEDISLSAFDTPGSGSATPSIYNSGTTTPGTRSRPTSLYGGVDMTALSSLDGSSNIRQATTELEDMSLADGVHDYFSRNNNYMQASAEPVEEELSRVPSYNTANAAPAAEYSPDLPRYE